MINLYILDSNLNKIALIDAFTSLIWTRRFSEVGEFKLVLPLNNELLSVIKKDYFVMNSKTEEIAIIESFNISTEENITNLEVKGRFIYALTDRRINNTTRNYNNIPVGGVIASLYNTNCVGGTNRGFNILNALESNLGANITIQDSYSNILEKTTDLLKTYKLGIKSVFDKVNKKVGFTIYQGKDLTQTIIFSGKYENVTSEFYEYNSTGHKTYALIGGEGEGAERIFTSTGGGSGLDLKEVFIDAKDLRKEDLTAEQYKNILISRGNEKLNDMTEANSFNSGINIEGNVKYKYDYNLGDRVAYISNLGIRAHLVIEEVEEVYEYGKELININFGTGAPKLSVLIKNMIGGK